jgi:hypothetical protein
VCIRLRDKITQMEPDLPKRKIQLVSIMWDRVDVYKNIMYYMV